MLVALITILLVAQYLGRILLLVILSYVDDRVLVIAFVVYVIGYLVNGFVSGSLYKQAHFPRTSPGWKSLSFYSACLGPGSFIYLFL